MQEVEEEPGDADDGTVHSQLEQDLPQGVLAHRRLLHGGCDVTRVTRDVVTLLSLLSLQLSCVLIAVFAIIMYRIIVVALLYASDDDVIKSNAKLATTATAACINLIVILIFNRVSVTSHLAIVLKYKQNNICFQVYERVAVFLTDLG